MNRQAFFDSIRQSFGRATLEQVEPVEWLLGKLESDPPASLEQAAYMLATVRHETADTYMPVREAFHKDEAWRKKNMRYYPWYGRGYVQLTWRDNYVRAGKELGLDLITDPDVVMAPSVAYAIMLRGMTEGWFTGKKLDDYIGNGKKDYRGARKIINGTDKDTLVAGYAETFEKALRGAKYQPKPMQAEQELEIDLPTLQAPFHTTAATMLLMKIFNATLMELKGEIEAFQRTQKLKPDGIVGPVTWRALFTQEKKS